MLVIPQENEIKTLSNYLTNNKAKYYLRCLCSCQISLTLTVILFLTLIYISRTRAIRGKREKLEFILRKF